MRPFILRKVNVELTADTGPPVFGKSLPVCVKQAGSQDVMLSAKPGKNFVC